MTHTSRFHRIAWLLALLLFGCRTEPERVVEVGGLVYTAEEAGRLDGEQRQLLADIAAFGLLAARAETDALVEPLAERAALRARSAQLPWLLAAREQGVAEAQLRQVYEAAPEWELTVRHVVRLVARWAPAEDHREARAVAEQARQRARAGEDFAAIAAELSQEPGAAERGGLLEPGRRGTWVDPFWAAAESLQPGEVSEVVETEYGFHVLRLDDRQPVPFEEADRAPLLRRAVAEPDASAAMEGWMIRHATALLLDAAAADAALAGIRAGEPPADTLVVARWQTADGGADGRYTARDLALFRASLDGPVLEQLDRAERDALAGRLEDDAYEAMLADEAGRLGAGPSDAAAADTRRREQTRVIRWAQGLGFREGMPREEVRTAALRALAAGGQEARLARMELIGMRPLLRELYPASVASPDPPSDASSSSTESSAVTG